MSLIITYSGVRGIYGKDLTRDNAYRFARAYGTYLQGQRTFVARDTRPSGKVLLEQVKRGLRKTGCDVIDLGICPTPTIQLAVKTARDSGGIMITASHNPVEPEEWNGFKPLSTNGLILDSPQLGNLSAILEQGNFLRFERTTSLLTEESAIQLHIQRILENVDVRLIRQARFTVAFDPGNGAGARAGIDLLQKLGCKTYAINTEMDGRFARPPEPIPRNLSALSKLAHKQQVDIGFAQDADADRLVLAAENGQILSEEYSLALAASSLLSNRAFPSSGLHIVTNVSTSRMIDDVAKKFGARVWRTPTGELKVVQKMQQVGAVIGGEGNGGIIFPSVLWGGRDSLSGMALILWYMAKTEQRLSTLAGQFPKYNMIKIKVEGYPREQLQGFISKAKESYQQEIINETDGIKIIFSDDSWLLLRLSNTEPIMRIFVEAVIPERAKAIFDEAIEKLDIKL